MTLSSFFSLDEILQILIFKHGLLPSLGVACGERVTLPEVLKNKYLPKSAISKKVKLNVIKFGKKPKKSGVEDSGFRRGGGK